MRLRIFERDGETLRGLALSGREVSRHIFIRASVEVFAVDARGFY
jgi:hypothetical protein